MRNVAVAVLRQPGYGGQTVAAVMGLTVNYVVTLHRLACRSRRSWHPGRNRNLGERTARALARARPGKGE